MLDERCCQPSGVTSDCNRKPSSSTLSAQLGRFQGEAEPSLCYTLVEAESRRIQCWTWQLFIGFVLEVKWRFTFAGMT